MNTERLNEIYNKFPKVELEKVELSLIDDIEATIKKGLSLRSEAYKALEIGKKEMQKAYDIPHFEMADYYVKAEKLIDIAEQRIKTLGLDTKYISKLKQRLEILDSAAGTIMQDIKATGFKG